MRLSLRQNELDGLACSHLDEAKIAWAPLGAELLAGAVLSCGGVSQEHPDNWAIDGEVLLQRPRRFEAQLADAPDDEQTSGILVLQ